MTRFYHSFLKMVNVNFGGIEPRSIDLGSEGIPTPNQRLWRRTYSSPNPSSVKPDFYDAWHNKGNVFKDLQRYQEALDCYDKALQFKPDFYYAWTGKGAVFQDLQRYQKALDCYDKALQLQPDFYYAWTGKGAVFQDL